MNEKATMPSQQKKTSRQLQAEQTKKKLLEVSLKLVREQGFDNVKIGDICREAGVSTGAFYHHLTSKAGIVTETYDQCDRYFIETVYPQFKDRNTVDAILDYICLQMEYAQNYGVDITTQIYKAQLTEGTEFFLGRDRALPAGLTGIISHLQDRGVIRKDKSAQEISNEILVIARGILYNWCQSRGEYDLQSFARTVVANYIKAYQP